MLYTMQYACERSYDKTLNTNLYARSSNYTRFELKQIWCVVVIEQITENFMLFQTIFVDFLNLSITISYVHNVLRKYIFKNMMLVSLAK